MDNLEIEISGRAFVREENPVDLTDVPVVEDLQEQAIVFSNSILLALQQKVKHFNENYKPLMVTLPQLKSVYRNGAAAFASAVNWQGQFPEKTCGDWGLSRVNMFLRMKSGDGRRDSVESLNFSRFVDISESWCPIQEDFDQTKRDKKEYNLNYNFTNVDELYLDDYIKVNIDY